MQGALSRALSFREKASRKKEIMKKIGLVLFGLGLLFSPPLHAQTTHLTPAIITIAAAAAPQTDPIAFSNAPMVGLFYSAQNPDLPPAPSDFANLPVWDLGDGNYLLDDFDSDLRRQSGIGGAVQDDSPPTPPGDGGSGGSPSTNGISYSFDTNGLWLEMVDVSTNGYAGLNLHNATNQIYAIWGTPDLTGGWTVLTEVWPTNASVMPFTVPLTNQQTLFMQAEDWTGVTENGNTTPDWWFWKYFGTTALSDTNLDSHGNTLSYDYQNGLDPNVISFSVNDNFKDYLIFKPDPQGSSIWVTLCELDWYWTASAQLIYGSPSYWDVATPAPQLNGPLDTDVIPQWTSTLHSGESVW